MNLADGSVMITYYNKETMDSCKSKNHYLES